jgi:hypothetical protein
MEFISQKQTTQEPELYNLACKCNVSPCDLLSSTPSNRLLIYIGPYIQHSLLWCFTTTRVRILTEKYKKIIKRQFSFFFFLLNSSFFYKFLFWFEANERNSILKELHTNNHFQLQIHVLKKCASVVIQMK